MRGTRWIAALAIALFVLVPTSLYATAQEPQPRGASAPDAPDATRLEEWTGQSAIHLRGACAEGVREGITCVGDMTREDGTFFLGAPAQAGHIVVSWRAVNDSLRTLRVHLAGLVVEGESPIRIEIPGLEAGEHAIRLEPARRVIGQHEQVADWIASFAVTTPFDTVEASGASGYETVVGCALALCDPLTRARSETIVVPWSARGELVATWDSVDDGPMRVSVRGTGFVAEGQSPLVLDLDGLTAGEWAIDVLPTGVALPLATYAVGWRATLARA